MDVATLEPQTLAFLAALEAQGEPPLYTLAPAEARQALLALNQVSKIITI